MLTKLDIKFNFIVFAQKIGTAALAQISGNDLMHVQSRDGMSKEDYASKFSVARMFILPGVPVSVNLFSVISMLRPHDTVFFGLFLC